MCVSLFIYKIVLYPSSPPPLHLKLFPLLNFVRNLSLFSVTPTHNICKHLHLHLHWSVLVDCERGWWERERDAGHECINIYKCKDLHSCTEFPVDDQDEPGSMELGHDDDDDRADVLYVLSVLYVSVRLLSVACLLCVAVVLRVCCPLYPALNTNTITPTCNYHTRHQMMANARCWWSWS